MPRKEPIDQRQAQQSPTSEGRFAYDGLDRVMHEKARLGIMASLISHTGGLLFNDLKQVCSLTDGNLSRHLAVLTEAGLVEIRKGANGPRTQTMYRLTSSGRHRFAEYIRVLEKVVADAQLEGQADANQQHLSNGWSPAPG
jgi:DNA-binding MarR family transcriptional regulator